MPKKKIAVIIPTLDNGGAERVVSHLSSSFSSKYELITILFNNKRIDYKCEGLVISLDLKISNNYIVRLINYLIGVYRLRKILRDYHIETVVSHLEDANIINVLSKKLHKAIITVHNNQTQKACTKKGLRKQLRLFKTSLVINNIYSKADKIITVSEGIKNDLITNYRINKCLIKKIYNPIDVKEITHKYNASIAEEFIKTFEKPTIITIGRLIDQKGQWHLIRALKKVKESINDINLIILGKGDLKNYLVDLTKELDLEDSVHFLGFQENPYKYLKKSDLFVLSSLHEGFGMVITEALVCETLIISTDCNSGPREILDGTNTMPLKLTKEDYCDYGILIPLLDKEKYRAMDQLTAEETILADTIINVLNNKNLRNQYEKKGILRGTEFDIKYIEKEWFKIIG